MRETIGRRCVRGLLVLALIAALFAGCGRAAKQQGTVTELVDGTEQLTENGTEQLAENGTEQATETLSTEIKEAASSETGEGTQGASSGNDASAQPVTGSSAKGAFYGALHVSGTQLVDGKGNPVQLRGISTHGLAWYPDYVNEALFRQLHEEWKVNVIRLAMYTAESGGYCTDGNKAQLKKLVKNGVQYATNQGMYAIIDWHILSDANPNQHKSEAKDFFREMSQTYASYSNVLYEICNEPNGGTSWSEIKAYANEIIPVIRANDPDAVILVGTPNWSQYVDQAAADPITGYDNIMYTLHFYAATHTDSLRNTMTSAIRAGLPVFVTEYGICDASGNGGINESQANQWVQVMDQYGVSYVAWNLSNKNETSAIFSSSCSKTSGFTEADLSASGKWLYRMLTNGNGGMPASGPTGGNSGTGSTGAGGNSGAGSTGGGGNSGAGSTGSGGNNGGAGNSGSGGNNGGASAVTANVLTNGGVSISAAQTNHWESNGQYFYQYNVTLTNTSGKAGTAWAIDIPFNESFSLSDKWNGNYTVNGNTLHITSMDYNGSLAAGAAADNIGFIISGSANLKTQ